MVVVGIIDVLEKVLGIDVNVVVGVVKIERVASIVGTIGKKV